jgi:hypothetical protein
LGKQNTHKYQEASKYTTVREGKGREGENKDDSITITGKEKRDECDTIKAERPMADICALNL